MSLHESFPLSLKQILVGVRKESKDGAQGQRILGEALTCFSTLIEMK